MGVYTGMGRRQNRWIPIQFGQLENITSIFNYFILFKILIFYNMGQAPFSSKEMPSKFIANCYDFVIIWKLKINCMHLQLNCNFWFGCAAIYCMQGPMIVCSQCNKRCSAKMVLRGLHAVPVISNCMHLQSVMWFWLRFAALYCMQGPTIACSSCNKHSFAHWCWGCCMQCLLLAIACICNQ